LVFVVFFISILERVYLIRKVPVSNRKELSPFVVVLSGLVVVMLATGPKVCRFKPGCGQWVFKGDKNL
jgi:hypothetical protein